MLVELRFDFFLRMDWLDFFEYKILLFGIGIGAGPRRSGTGLPTFLVEVLWFDGDFSVMPRVAR